MVAGMVAPMIHMGQPVAGAQTRPVKVTLAGLPQDAFFSLEITLVAGEDAARETTQRMLGETALQDHGLGIGNVYDVYAVSGTRTFRDRNVTIMPGSATQEVVLAPVFRSDEVTLDLPDAPIVAAPGTFMPVTLRAPADFNGSIALHDADDRDAPAIFTISGADLMGSSDPVLPVPERPGFYEIQFQDMKGEMFGGIGFEVVADDRAQSGTAPEGSVSVALLSDGDLVAGSGGYFPVDIAAPAGLAGELQIESKGGAVVYTTDLATLIAAQDPTLPIPDAPGVYMISIMDQTGMLRATTGFEVRGPADQAGITVTLRATTQFGAGCMIGANLSMPSGPRMTITIPVAGVDAQGAAVSPIMQRDGGQILEIMGFDTTGATLVDASFLSPCEALVLNMGPAQCRVGESSTPGPCPYPVSYVAPPTLLAVQQAGSDQNAPTSGQAALPDRSGPATTRGADFIEIDLGDMDADTFLDILLPQTGSE